MRIDAVFLLTGKKLVGEAVMGPNGVGMFVRDGHGAYSLVPAHAVASVHFIGTKEEIDRMFSAGEILDEASKVPIE